MPAAQVRTKKRSFLLNIKLRTSPECTEYRKLLKIDRRRSISFKFFEAEKTVVLLEVSVYWKCRSIFSGQDLL